MTRLTENTRARLAGFVACCAVLLLQACASGPQANPRDPLEPFNRKMMEFNEGVDAVALKPAATVYRKVVPPLVRTGVANFFSNLGDAWSAINSALQLKLHDATDNIFRFNINTFFGLGGVLDIASELNIERHKEDFGQTIGRWGVPAGPYLVLPLLGPSTLRDTFVLPVERRGDILANVDPWGAQGGLYVLRAVDIRSNLLRAGEVLDQAALDKYSFTRDAHLQRRRAEIFDSNDADSSGQEPKLETEPDPKTDSALGPAPVGENAPADAPATTATAPSR